MLTRVMYDIVKDKTRNKVAKCCEKAGIYRVQYSVFLGDMNKTKCKELSCQINELINPEVDRVYIFLCVVKILIIVNYSDKLLTLH